MDNSYSGTVYDVIIIGGGPAGLSAALYTSRAKLSTLVLDKNPTAGALGSASAIENYPGIPGAIKGVDLLKILKKQAESFDAQVIQEQVIGTDLEASPKQVFTNENTYQGKTVIIATGSMGRSANIKGEIELTGKGVSYCAACDAAFFKGKHVAVAGKIEETIEEAESLARFAEKIYLITIEKEISEDLSNIVQAHPAMELKTGYRITEIKGDNKVTSIETASLTNEKDTLEVEGVFLYLHGNKPVVDFLYGVLGTDKESCIVVDPHTMATAIEGVYAAGDVNCSQIRQVVVSASEGCIAALSVEKFIKKQERTLSHWAH